MKTAKKLRVENGRVILDPNNWDEMLWGLDDEMCDFAEDNKEQIEDYAKFHNVTLWQATKELFI